MTVFPKDLLGLDMKRKNDNVFGSVCHSSETHNTFEAGDHLKTFGAALEPAPQGFVRK